MPLLHYYECDAWFVISFQLDASFSDCCQLMLQNLSNTEGFHLMILSITKMTTFQWYVEGILAWVINGITMTGKYRNTLRKTFSSANLLTTNPTQTGLELNPDFCSGKPVTNCLSHGKSCQHNSMMTSGDTNHNQDSMYTKWGILNLSSILPFEDIVKRPQVLTTSNL